MSDYLEISIGTKIILNKPPSFGSKAVIFRVCETGFGFIVCKDMRGRQHIIDMRLYKECGGRIYNKEKETLRKQNRLLLRQNRLLLKQNAGMAAALDSVRCLNLDRPTYQERVHEWAEACFGEDTAKDKTERNHRFLEEAVELVQSLGCTEKEVICLVEYVYGREKGDPEQEVGGVATTLATLCTANGIDMKEASEKELKNIWNRIDKIRHKQANKPKFSPLPQ